MLIKEVLGSPLVESLVFNKTRKNFIMSYSLDEDKMREFLSSFNAMMDKVLNIVTRERFVDIVFKDKALSVFDRDYLLNSDQGLLKYRVFVNTTLRVYCRGIDERVMNFSLSSLLHEDILGFSVSSVELEDDYEKYEIVHFIESASKYFPMYAFFTKLHTFNSSVLGPLRLFGVKYHPQLTYSVTFPDNTLFLSYKLELSSGDDIKTASPIDDEVMPLDIDPWFLKALSLYCDSRAKTPTTKRLSEYEDIPLNYDLFFAWINDGVVGKTPCPTEVESVDVSLEKIAFYQTVLKSLVQLSSTRGMLTALSIKDGVVISAIDQVAHNKPTEEDCVRLLNNALIGTEAFKHHLSLYPDFITDTNSVVITY